MSTYASANFLANVFLDSQLEQLRVWRGEFCVVSKQLHRLFDGHSLQIDRCDLFPLANRVEDSAPPLLLRRDLLVRKLQLFLDTTKPRHDAIDLRRFLRWAEPLKFLQRHITAAMPGRQPQN